VSVERRILSSLERLLLLLLLLLLRAQMVDDRD